MNHQELIEQEELKADGKELIEEVKSCNNCDIERFGCYIKDAYELWYNDGVHVFSCSLFERKPNNE